MKGLRARVMTLETATARREVVFLLEGQDEAAAIAARYPDGPPPGLEVVVYRLRWADDPVGAGNAAQH